MKRQKHRNHTYFRVSDYSNDHEDSSEYPLQPTINTQTNNFNILEAQIQEGDTLQAIALRFNCTVAELKRLNKIEKEYEIHARKIIKVPVTPHSLLLENQPLVHRSGQSSPKHGQNNKENVANENLLSAAVSLSTEPSINDIILNTPIASNHYEDATAPKPDHHSSAIDDPLLGDASNEYGGMDSRSRPHSISGQNIDFRDFSCSGSDCDISWIFLLICILVLCFAIPLVYVFYIAEQEEIHRHDHNQSHQS
ncbi:lysM and putative peptidoglycan-binding domain-containing protein 3 [Bradysia coprophila]|uniref:lysM and putative peptidoglycan-binding domain-containing protein 3 n=1 Tax=Bradysia coprophila TaxID=38358 RepID=UPI00187DA5E8|nr:lysM and putative peptidoglycan-binding domain-containing protein 3 [Bradysia coprophila]